MEEDELVREIDRLAQAATDHPIQEEYNPDSAEYKRLKVWDFYPPSPRDDLEAVGRAALGLLPQPAIISAVEPFGRWLVGEARARPASEVLREIRDFLASDSVTWQEIAALWGIALERPIDLGIEGIRLVPIDEIRQSGLRDSVTGVSESKRTPFTGFHPPRATAALVHDVVTSPIRSRDWGSEGPMTPELKKLDLMMEISRMLVVAVGAPVEFVGEWGDVTPGTPFFGEGQGSWSDWFHFSQEPRPHVVDETLLVELVQGYVRMPERDRRSLRITLERLNEALMGGRRRVDDMIDLGVAMESFLLRDIDPPTELTFRFALRGSRYLRGTLAERIDTSRQLKKAYRHRSEAVHTGDFAKGDHIKQNNAVVEATGLFLEMLRRTMLESKVPVWELIELG